MDNTVYGKVGLALGICAVCTGTGALLLQSLYHGILYLIISVICGILVTLTFCAKCQIKTDCVHVVPGYIARFWPERNGPYTSTELLITTILFAVIIIPPQAALFSFPGLFGFFWISISTSAICSKRFLCPGCGNLSCPFNANK